ncbi:alpha/beta hydrolase [Salipiger mangrovisoli]|uniref:Peptidase S33 tripeptidyl aminopeptidase-like C-terminal domain-containing protein n=1 Tax=Salipiger mangrovisoli TaxID=2865933 RepID=A0ABR9X2Q3_9RHOB|nr:alpha/beta hydrolase [Salipiger mangrovisoli]MBE9637791.1 hypothetical protein [Salipiger mangrovisoli]
MRRRLLHLAAALLPGPTGRLVAWRYLSPASHLDPAHAARTGAQLLPLGADMAVLRYPARQPAAPRVLLVPGHDGHVRQFARLVRELRLQGAAVDLLILPGHLSRRRKRCGLAEIVPAIQDCGTTHGPYDAVAAHCVSASGLLFALAEGFDCPRLAFISTPIDLGKLLRLGATQFGLSGRCRAAFEAQVIRQCAPYGPEAPWRRVAAARRGETLVLHARHDVAAPLEDARAFAEAVPGGRFEVVDEADHNGLLHVVPAARRLARFLAAR